MSGESQGELPFHGARMKRNLLIQNESLPLLFAGGCPRLDSEKTAGEAETVRGGAPFVI